MLFFYINKLTTYLTFLIFLTAIIGDYVVSYSKLHVFQALFDNTTHFLIGGLSWLIVCLNSKDVSHTEKIIEVVICSLISSLIDIDHFIEARSINLKNATKLKHRPFLHCSTFPLAFCILLFLTGHVLDNYALKRNGLLLFTAFGSHHTRDATRRGYWFYPFGSTVPLPYIMYIGISCVLPHTVMYVHRYFNGLKNTSRPVIHI
ncbi:transmembrane protein 267 [Diabrotica virgifera virgifera]|uniref:Transmembrane protein 267 n=1 Tax=Diabrotica virgifera virgifera TaxID=50390 RepID=A0A6P7FT59_DIAVI|nr:transmembrane protein 267 [Diabrotica virgifera virgifera]